MRRISGLLLDNQCTLFFDNFPMVAMLDKLIKEMEDQCQKCNNPGGGQAKANADKATADSCSVTSRTPRGSGSRRNVTSIRSSGEPKPPARR